jgi:hypothetical protein
MKEIRIFDTLFAHVEYSTLFQKSKYFYWNRKSTNTELAIYTDTSVQTIDKKIKYNIAWLLESPVITPHAYIWIRTNYQQYDTIVTFKKEFLEMDPKFEFGPVGGCWIKPEDQKIYPKTKLVSTIVSAKRNTLGQMMRHQVLTQFPHNIDVFGQMYNPLDYKLNALQDYMFSITIENIKEDYYFTEKIIDCFMTGTIPIYWGCPSIANFFNPDGIIFMDRVKDLTNIFDFLTPEYYNSKLPAIYDNFERAKAFLIAEDYMYEHILKNKII